MDNGKLLQVINDVEVFEIDHDPDGYPAIKTWQVALLKEAGCKLLQVTSFLNDQVIDEVTINNIDTVIGGIIGNFNILNSKFKDIEKIVNEKTLSKKFKK